MIPFAKTTLIKVAAGILATAGIAVTIAACTTTPQTADASKAPKQCLMSPLETTRVIDESTLYISDRSGKSALVHMNGSCMSTFEPVGFKFHGASDICDPIDADITGSLSSIPTHCFVKSIEFLTKEQDKAYSGASAKTKS